VDEFEGAANDKGNGTALAALMSPEFDEAAVIYAPAASIDVVKALIRHCKNKRSRFAVIDSPLDVSDPVRLDPRIVIQTSFAAFYYPWLITLANESRT